MSVEYTATSKTDIADFLATLASDQRSSVRFQSTQKAKAECLTKATAYEDAANIVRKTKIVGHSSHGDAAYTAYYDTSNRYVITKLYEGSWIVRELSQASVSAAPLSEVSEATANEGRWNFADEITAKRFVVTKLLDAIVSAVLSI